MGLDGVEIVMALEEGFGVTISDGEARECATPGSLIDLIFAKLRASNERVCVSQRAFYLLRKGLKGTLGVARRNVTLDTDIRSFVAGRPDREVWNDLKNAVQARSWPKLERPLWLVGGIWILSILTFCGFFAAGHLLTSVVCTVLVAFLGTRLTRPYGTLIPRRYTRVRELVPFVATSDAISWTRDQVATLVKKTVIEILGLKDGVYREDAHFVKDLGIE
ncbi:MAG: hypothetical protein HZC54_06675 [Verrucomicrobia bacterium]|nr:hypothetical protein [Verrucomicrobiota bacterium]